MPVNMTAFSIALMACITLIIIADISRDVKRNEPRKTKTTARYTKDGGYEEVTEYE